MRVPLFWLADHCDPGLPAAELGERLAMTGTEVERIERHGVTALEAHPMAPVAARAARSASCARRISAPSLASA